MGGCCSCRAQVNIGVEEQRETRPGDLGARVRVRGSSGYSSMYSRQGTKGVNQDAMTVWEEFVGEKDTYFCGVFDGHGPYGDKIAGRVSDRLPSKLSANIKQAQVDHLSGKSSNGQSLETSVKKSFKQVDEELKNDAPVDPYYSGTTAVVAVKQGDNLMIANLGDSRAVLCTKGYRDELVPVQLSQDLKPNVPSEAERIYKSKGRIFSLDEEPGVFRVWMPQEDCPGLAMSRAFGDFCLKNHGLTSTPEVSYRKLTKSDEFIVLATDGVWDVLSNEEVVRIVASARRRSSAAKLLVSHAVRTWRTKYPGAKVDDCAVVCLFLKDPEMSLDPLVVSSDSASNESDLTIAEGEGEGEVEEVSRVNTLVNVPERTSDVEKSRLLPTC